MDGAAIECADATAPASGREHVRPVIWWTLLRAWAVCAAVLASTALALFNLIASRSLAEWFLLQDLPVLAAGGLVLAAALAIGASGDHAAGAARLGARTATLVAIGAAALVLAAGLAGARWVMLGYPLAMDEFMAQFDARAMLHGWLAAPVAPGWRPFVPALQPIFGLITPDHAVWRSDYLPLNAAWRALCTLGGLPALSGALPSALAVLIVYDLARKLWPARPDAAVAAALFLASSTQLLFTAMTPYAMPAHLALNCAWVWLYRRGRRGSDVAALGVGWAACGLHQLPFHLLFAAPFVAELWWARRWARAAGFTLGYAAIALSWVLFWPAVFSLAGLHAPEGKAGGVVGFSAEVAELVRSGHPVLSVRLTVENLIRFAAWQNPLAVALLLVGAPAALARPGLLRSLAAGMVLTVAACTLLMPFQGHGWGYRYLHGSLGGAALVAAFAYVRLTERGWAAGAAWRCLWASVAGVLLVLLPWRAAQVRTFVQPYATAHAAIAASGAAAVVVDPSRIAFGEDLVRNDPALSRRPLVFSLLRLPRDRMDEVCRLGRVELFDVADARRAGMITGMLAVNDLRAPGIRARLLSAGCGDRHVLAPASETSP